jgi:hypothetical protein
MFFGVIFIAMGVAILLNALGILNGTFWGFFWGIFFVAVGAKMMMKKGMCPVCGWYGFGGKMHDKIHNKMHGQCCDHDHHEEEIEPEQ